MMKNLLTIILMAAVVLTACTKENITVTEPAVDQIVTINATIAGDTKVALGEEDEKKVNWTAGDIINLTIKEVAYSFTWQEGTTFAYTGDAILPALTQDLQITASYAPEFSTTQTGLKADVGNYMALTAEETVDTEKNYGELNLTFSHETSVLKLTLSNEAFKGADVTDITVKAGTEVVAKATATFTGDNENGSVTAYLAIKPDALSDVTIHATCEGNTYTNVLGNNTIAAGKIYKVNKPLPYAYVDLGLSVKWASFNVGATSPEGYGDLVSWGETETKETYDYGDYKYMAENYLKSLTKYCYDSSYGHNGYTDDLNTLESEDDAATQNWGTSWRMPTSAEMEELIENSTQEWITINGVKGCLVTSLFNNKSIFFPAAGYKDYSGEHYSKNEYGYYWSSSLSTTTYTNQAYYLSVGEPSEYWEVAEIWEATRNEGQSVRPVYIGN